MAAHALRLSLLRVHASAKTDLQADLNTDGECDVKDMLALLKAFGENYALKFNEMIPKSFGCCADKNCPEKVKHGEFCCAGAPLIYVVVISPSCQM